MQDRVLQLILDLIQDCDGPVEVMFTGASALMRMHELLGGLSMGLQLAGCRAGLHVHAHALQASQACLVSSARHWAALSACLPAGHSLGGALATLAAYDLSKHSGRPQVHISCFTFGAPRTGSAPPGAGSPCAQ